MKTAVVYPSKPLEGWGKLMEVRRRFAVRMWTAKERGELQIIGGTGGLHALPYGLGEFHYFGGLGPNFGRIMENRPLLINCIETAETMGYGPDTCSTLRVTLGSMFLGEFDKARTGEHVQADFVLDMQVCQSQGKTDQLWHEYYHDIPAFTIEVPPTLQQKQYLVDQMQECILWMEKVTGRKYDDERLIEGVKNEWKCRNLWSRMMLLQKNIPAPMDQLTIFSLATITWRGGRHRKETVELYQMFLDELEERAKQGIATRPYETARLMHEGAATWYKSSVLRYPRDYGASFIGSYQAFLNSGCFSVEPDHSLKLGPTLEEAGYDLRNREQALQALAELYVHYSPATTGMYCLDSRIDVRLKVYRDWKADAVIFNLDRGCRGTSLAQTETGFMCQREGIPCMYYEGNVTNPRELDEGEYQARIDSLMESLSLKKLEVQEAPSQVAVEEEEGGGHVG